MHIMSTSAVLIRTQTLSPVEGAEVAEISMMLFIKQNPCHKIVTLGYSLAFEGSGGIFYSNHVHPA